MQLIRGLERKRLACKSVDIVEAASETLALQSSLRSIRIGTLFATRNDVDWTSRK